MAPKYPGDAGVLKTKPYVLVIGSSQPQVRDVFRREFFMTEFYPVIGNALLGRDGALWIQPMYEPSVWRVAVAGRLTMRVRVPDGTDLMAVSRENAWGVRKAADGVPMIVRYRLAPAR